MTGHLPPISSPNLAKFLATNPRHGGNLFEAGGQSEGGVEKKIVFEGEVDLTPVLVVHQQKVKARPTIIGDGKRTIPPKAVLSPAFVSVNHAPICQRKNAGDGKLIRLSIELCFQFMIHEDSSSIQRNQKLAIL